MNSLYNHGIKQTQLLSKDLATFEKNLSTSPLSLQGSITTSLNSFRKTVKEYGDLINQNLHEEQSQKHEARLDRFKADLKNFSAKFDELKRRRDEVIQDNNKQELLGRRNAAQSHKSENPYESNQGIGQQQSLSALESLYNERGSLGRSTQQLDQILEMGQQALEDIVDQNQTLRKLHATFNQSLMTLGVSQGTIRKIEHRARQDKWIFWIAFLLTMVCFWYILKVFR